MAAWITKLTVKINAIIIFIHLITAVPLFIFMVTTDFPLSGIIDTLAIGIVYIYAFVSLILLLFLLGMNAAYGRATSKKYKQGRKSFFPHVFAVLFTILIGSFGTSFLRLLLSSIPSIFVVYSILMDVVFVLNLITPVIGIGDFFFRKVEQN